MKLLHKIDEFLASLSVFKFIMIITIGMILGSFVWGVVSCVVASVWPGVETTIADQIVMQESLVTQFIAAIIVTPLLETLLFQLCAIKLLRKIKILKYNNFMVIVISALIFGLQHFYSVDYIINTTIAGMFLSYAFIIYEKKRLSPFWVVCTIHSLRNLFSLIIINMEGITK